MITKHIPLPESQARFLRTLRANITTLQTRMEGALQLAAASAAVSDGSISLNEEGTHLAVSIPDPIVLNQPDAQSEKE